MKTQRRILLVVGTFVLAFGVLVAAAEILLGGLVGSLVVAGVVVAAVAIYVGLVRPWQVRWGATADEVARPMPGDGILGPPAPSTTRAITIGAPADQVWPWLAQLGYGRAGWYSYDWLDNDGQPSASQIWPEWQQLRPGDQILMMPGAGFDVVEVQDGHYFTAQAPDQTMSWCLAVEPLGQHSCRLSAAGAPAGTSPQPAPSGSCCLIPAPSSWSARCCSGSRRGQSRRRSQNSPTTVELPGAAGRRLCSPCLQRARSVLSR